MPRYSVTIAIDVPAYATVEVEASSPEEVRAKVQDELDKWTDGQSTVFRDDLTNPDWSVASGERVVLIQDGKTVVDQNILPTGRDESEG